ncbi:MAG TPA: TIGR03667 family PPOX class F420-dependent oxidoreductase [Anaerolineae bacterium]
MKIDETTKFGARVIERLHHEQVIWLTTVRSDGIPQPNPVWFLWDGEAFIIYSQPHAKKVSHIKAHPKVSLNFDSNEGDDIAVFTGEAQIDTSAPDVLKNAAYLRKYHQGIVSMGSTDEKMAESYSTVIRVTPSYMRGF